MDFRRRKNRLFTIAARAFMKIVWGDVRWEKKHRGGDEIYGESIYTKRALIGSYQLPFRNDASFQETYISRQPIRHDELYCESKIGFLQ
jgi:outer membrane receptor for ferrienterochelin and colicins